MRRGAAAAAGLLLVGLALGLWLSLPSGGGAARLGKVRPAGDVVVDTSFRSHALGTRLHFIAVLPPGYTSSHLRYPVVYFLHGLPAGPTSYRSVAWIGDAVADTGRNAIVVVPQGTRRLHGDPEYHDWGPGHNWETALSVELPRVVDARFRTIATRRGRGIAGLSAGGYGAMIIDAHHPAEYAAVESWSGYFHATDPTGRKPRDLGSAEADAEASVDALVPRLKRLWARDPTYVAFYVGRSDPTFVPDNRRLNAELTEARIPHVYAVYPGGHTNALWQTHAQAWLGMMLRHLVPPRQG